MKLASFDIFDTALIRKCGRSASVFYLQARRLFPDDDGRAAVFLAWRKQAEQEACRKNNSENIRLEQIYDGFAEKTFGLSREEAAGMEKDIERENLMINPAVGEIIGQKRAEGFRVCFISDMYLDSTFLREALEGQGLILPDEDVVVSCEWGVRKSTGKLFAAVRKKYDPSQWEHYGDNDISDYRRPRQQGIKAFRINTGYTEAEKWVEEKYKCQGSAHDVSVFVGFQRAARISGGNTSFAELGADFVAPAYIPYVRYVLEQARNNGIRRLYFVNRDGYILMKIAGMFREEYPEIELKYIFISRRSIVLPSLTAMDPALVTETLQPQSLIGKRVKGLLHYLHIDEEILERMGITFSYDRITHTAEAEDFQDKLFRSAYTPYLERQAGQSREMFKRYLDQEGFTDGTKSAMVDLGWYGSTRLMLNRILDHYGCARAPFFYFSAADNALPSRHGEYFAYLPYGVVGDSGLIAVMEHYYSASPYGSAVAYEEKDGKIIPILDGHVLTAGYKHIISANIETSTKILSYLKKIPYISLELICIDYLRLMNELRVNVNLQACSETENFVDFTGEVKVFTRKMTIFKTLKYAFLGLEVTAFDKGSVFLTYGRRISNVLFFCNKHSSKVARCVYAQYMLYRQSGRMTNKVK